MKHQFTVFIGRFSPFHNAHKAILEEAFKLSEKVIIVIGSSGTPRTIRNPWSYAERVNMISTALTEGQRLNAQFIHMRDRLYNDNAWTIALQEKVHALTGHAKNIALIGFETDETSYYLKLFPQFTYIPFKTEFELHATTIRNLYFSRDAAYTKCIPNSVANFLKHFETTQEFHEIKEEKDFVDEYKEQWRGSPFPPIFVTVDAVVIKSGHILVVSRKHNPGKGLLALPGGFLNKGERLKESVLREIKEETRIKMNIHDLRKCIVESEVFDEPKRSERGRTITHAFLFDLGVGDLPEVKADDDAAGCWWLPLNEFYTLEDKFFEDHFHILTHFISRY